MKGLFKILLIDAAVALGLAVLESDQLADWVHPAFRTPALGIQGVAEAVGLGWLRSQVREGFWRWLEELGTPPPGQESGLEPQQIPSPALSRANPLRILVLGDSLAGFYLPNALGVLAAEDGRGHVESLYRVAASLANPARMDFLTEVPRFWDQRRAASGRDFEVVVVLMGANDGQAIRKEGRWLAFGSEEWRRELGHRVRTLLDFLCARAQWVYWLQMPPMREADLESRVRVVEEVYRTVIAQYPNAEFVWQRHLLARDGEYTPVGVVEGRQVILRARDGIHLSSHGARILARDLWVRIMGRFVFESPPSNPRDPGDSAADPSASPGLASPPPGR